MEPTILRVVCCPASNVRVTHLDIIPCACPTCRACVDVIVIEVQGRTFASWSRCWGWGPARAHDLALFRAVSQLEVGRSANPSSILVATLVTETFQLFRRRRPQQELVAIWTSGHELGIWVVLDELIELACVPVMARLPTPMLALTFLVDGIACVVLACKGPWIHPIGAALIDPTVGVPHFSVAVVAPSFEPAI